MKVPVPAAEESAFLFGLDFAEDAVDLPFDLLFFGMSSSKSRSFSSISASPSESSEIPERFDDMEDRREEDFDFEERGSSSESSGTMKSSSSEDALERDLPDIQWLAASSSRD